MGAARQAVPAAPAASAAGTLSDGPVRVVAVARSTYAGHAEAEAQRAIDVALEGARTMLGATGRNLDATQQALARAVLNRWRTSRPADLPLTPAGQGTTLTLALASAGGVRLTAFGGGYAAALAADGALLALDGALLALELPPHSHRSGDRDNPPELADAHDPDDPDDEEGIAEPTGLDHPLARQQACHRRVSATDNPRVLWLSTGPVPAGETPDADWRAALGDMAEHLSRTQLDSDARHTEEGPEQGTASTEDGSSGSALAHRAAPLGSDEVAATEALAPVPDWLPPLLPESVSALVLAWPPAAAMVSPADLASPETGRRVKQAAPARERSGEPAKAPRRIPAVRRVREVSGSTRRRWTLVALSALLLLLVAASAWVWTRALTPGSAASVLPTTHPTSAAPSTASLRPTSAPPSSSSQTPSQVATPAAQAWTPAVTPRVRARTTAPPVATAAPANTSLPPTAAVPSTTQATTSTTSTAASTGASTSTAASTPPSSPPATP